MLADGGTAAREREHDLPADAGRRLAAAVGEDDDAEAALRDHADIGRGVVEAGVLVDDEEIVVLHPLPGERLDPVILFACYLCEVKVAPPDTCLLPCHAVTHSVAKSDALID